VIHVQRGDENSGSNFGWHKFDWLREIEPDISLFRNQRDEYACGCGGGEGVGHQRIERPGIAGKLYDTVRDSNQDCGWEDTGIAERGCGASGVFHDWTDMLMTNGAVLTLEFGPDGKFVGVKEIPKEDRTDSSECGHEVTED
jgi:hypothetical protein